MEVYGESIMEANYRTVKCVVCGKEEKIEWNFEEYEVPLVAFAVCKEHDITKEGIEDLLKSQISKKLGKLQ